MIRPQPFTTKEIGELESRAGVRAAVRAIWEYLQRFFEADYRFKIAAWSEITPLYGELDYTPALIANGARATVDITVTNAILGYCADVSYDQDLQGLQVTWYVQATDTVRVVLENNTGGGVTLTAGRFRAYVWPRTLSS